MRTPLNAILGFSNLLSKDPFLTHSQQENLNIINRSGEHLLALINDILEIAKIESGKTVLEAENFDFYYFLNSLEKMFALKAKSKNIQLIFDIHSTIPRYVKAIKNKLRQVLINLIGNAIKFTDKGQVKLQITLAESSEKHYTLLFKVQDTGVGIAPQDFSNLFKPFQQTQSGQKLQQGTGLGLALSKQLIELMGGTIKLDSKLGVGTKIQFTVPVKSIAEPEWDSSPSKGIIGLEPTHPDYQILIVEDHWENRKLLQEILESIGFIVRLAENGVQALKILEYWQPNLIFMDLYMPVMDGYETTLVIKNKITNQELKPLKIIALTASAFTETKTQVLNNGFDDFLPKPFKEQALLEIIAENLPITYVYEDTTLTSNSESINNLNLNITKEELLQEFLTMSSQWLKQLYQSCLALDEDECELLIEQISETNFKLKSSLQYLREKLDFETIVDSLETAFQELDITI